MRRAAPLLLIAVLPFALVAPVASAPAAAAPSSPCAQADDDDPRAEYDRRLAALADDDADGHHALGVWARENGLAKQATTRFEMAIRIDPDHAAAHEALGHELVEGKWLPPEEAERARVGWDYRGVHETDHFRIYYGSKRSLAEELGVYGEALVAAFAEAFADVGDLGDGVTKEAPLRVFVFKKTKDYADFAHDRVPHLARTLYPQYDPGSRTAYMAEEGSTKKFLIQSFVHESTHALAGRAMWSGGQWLSEGWADYMALSVNYEKKTVEPGRITQTKKSRHPDLVKLLLRKDEELPLGDLIGMDRLAFARNATKAYAQSWSLFHFLRHFGSGVYREGLVKYIRGTLEGKTGVEAFEEAVGPLDKMTREWKDYVQRLQTD